MTWDRLARALDQAFSEPEQAIMCSQCSTFIPALVDTQIAGTDPATRYPEVWTHVQQCSDCRQEYEDLLRMMRLVEADALPEPEEYPSFALPDVSEVQPAEKPSWLEQARETMARIAAQVRQGQAYPHAAVQIYVESGVEKITLALTPARLVTQPLGERGKLPSRYLYKLEDLDLEITVGMRTFEQGRRTVKGQIFLSPGEVQSLAGLAVHLASDQGPSRSTTVDDTGSFTFVGVPSGSYHLTIELGDGKAVQMDGLEV